MAAPAGYLPLSLFGVAPFGGNSDESIANFNVPGFVYAGETYSQVGVVSNGYVVVGGGDGGDVDFINSPLPDMAQPNNTLAPFWTDLNPASGGNMYIGILGDGVNSAGSSSSSRTFPCGVTRRQPTRSRCGSASTALRTSRTPTAMSPEVTVGSSPSAPRTPRVPAAT